jgi:chromosome segregation ATPase
MVPPSKKVKLVTMRDRLADALKRKRAMESLHHLTSEKMEDIDTARIQFKEELKGLKMEYLASKCHPSAVKVTYPELYDRCTVAKPSCLCDHQRIISELIDSRGHLEVEVMGLESDAAYLKDDIKEATKNLATLEETLRVKKKQLDDVLDSLTWASSHT